MEGGQAMDDDNIISLIYNKKNSEEMFKVKAEELNAWNTIEQTQKKIFHLVNSKLRPKHQNKFARLMQDLSDAGAEALSVEAQVYYKEGFRDGTKLSAELNAE